MPISIGDGNTIRSKPAPMIGGKAASRPNQPRSSTPPNASKPAAQNLGQLRAANQEYQRLAKQNESLPDLRKQNREYNQLRKEIEELPKLRNEARQLRRQADELQKLRAENVRLTAQAKTAATQPPNPYAPPPADFIPRASLTDSGLATPEAAARTFFWAMTQGNLERAVQCMAVPPAVTPENSELLRGQLIQQMSWFTGFRIADKMFNSPEVITLQLQLQSTVSGGESTRMELKRVNGEWKIGKMTD